MSKSRGPGLIFESQNLDIHHKGSAVKGTLKSIAKTSQKKGGLGLGQRKALQDISNASSLRQEASKKKVPTKGEFSVADERFLHDHEQCVATRKAEIDQYLHDVVQREHDWSHPDSSPKLKQVEADRVSPISYLELEPIPELQKPEKTDWFPSPTDSPLCSVHHELTIHPADKRGSMLKALDTGPGVKGALHTISTTSQKKDEGGLSHRKALQDISNSASLRQEVSSKIQNQNTENINVAEEGFLHNHDKCMRAQKADKDQYLYDTILFDHGIPCADSAPMSKLAEAVCASPPRYLDLEPIAELAIPAMTDWCPSPIYSPPQSPGYKMPELVLKSYIDN